MNELKSTKYNVFFCSENKNLFKNLNGLNLCLLPIIEEPTLRLTYWESNSGS